MIYMAFDGSQSGVAVVTDPVSVRFALHSVSKPL